MNENENSSVNNTEQPVTAVNEPLQEAAPVDPVVPTEPSIPEESVQQPVTPSIEPTVAQPAAPVESNKKSKVPYIIIAVLAVALVGTLVYFLFFKKVSKTQVINGTINKLFATAEQLSEKLDDAFIVDFKKDIVTTNGYLKASIETDDPDIKSMIGDIKNVSLKYDMQFNAKDLEAYINVSSNENDKEVINLSGLLTNKVVYLNSNVFDNVYKYDLTTDAPWDEIKEFIDSLPEYDSKTFSKLTKKFKTYLQKSIKDEYLTLEEGSFTVDGVEIKGSKTTLTLTDKVVNEMMKSIFTQAKDDSEFIEIVSKITKQDSENIKKSLSNTVDGLNEVKEFNEDNKSFVKIYTTTKGKFLGLEVISNDTTLLTAVSKDNVTTIKLYFGEVYKFTYDEKKKELTWVNEAEGNHGEKIVITFKDNGLKIEFSMEGLKITLEDEYNNTKAKLDEKVTASAEFTENGKTTKGSLEIACALEKADSIKKFDTTGAKDIQNITEYEKEQISDKFIKAVESTTLGKLLTAYKSTNNIAVNNSTNYNYYYDDDDWDF